MKWIEIAKAKPKFGVRYLTIEQGSEFADIGLLKEIKQTELGLEYIFEEDGAETYRPYMPTHIALITLPNQKEVENG